MPATLEGICKTARCPTSIRSATRSASRAVTEQICLTPCTAKPSCNSRPSELTSAACIAGALGTTAGPHCCCQPLSACTCCYRFPAAALATVLPGLRHSCCCAGPAAGMLPGWPCSACSSCILLELSCVLMLQLKGSPVTSSQRLLCSSSAMSCCCTCIASWSCVRQARSRYRPSVSDQASLFADHAHALRAPGGCASCLGCCNCWPVSDTWLKGSRVCLLIWTSVTCNQPSLGAPGEHCPAISMSALKHSLGMVEYDANALVSTCEMEPLST